MPWRLRAWHWAGNCSGRPPARGYRRSCQWVSTCSRSSSRAPRAHVGIRCCSAGAWSGFLGILGAVVQFAVAIGLLSMKRWAWFLAMIGVGLSVLQGIAGLFSGGPMAFMCGVLGLIVPVAVLIYLLTSKIRRAFGVDAG